MPSCYGNFLALQGFHHTEARLLGTIEIPSTRQRGFVHTICLWRKTFGPVRKEERALMLEQGRNADPEIHTPSFNIHCQKGWSEVRIYEWEKD